MIINARHELFLDFYLFFGKYMPLNSQISSGKSHFFFELFTFFGFFGSILKLKSQRKPVFLSQNYLTFLEMDPSYATLGFINFLALEFVYKARKTNCDFPDAVALFN